MNCVCVRERANEMSSFKRERERKMVGVLYSPFMQFILCLLITSNSGTTNAQKTPPTEVGALNIILTRWGQKANSKWNISGEPCSGWAIDSTELNNNIRFNPGIKCDCSYDSNKTCHIVKLLVYSLNVEGTIPVELQQLTYLADLNLGQNYLTGTIPAFVGNMTRMQYLNIGINALSGPIPNELGNLQNLISLGLGGNNFSGSVPDEFGNFTNLQQLYISNSGLSGELPETLSNLKNMRILRAWGAFTGKIPDYIGTSWTALHELRFDGSSFEGPIPSSLSNLVQLTSLRIGDISSGDSSTLDFISNMTSLSTLILRNCRISDTLLTDFSKFTNLQYLDLSFNNITGEVPESLFSLSTIKYLFLGNNSLNGSLPSQKTSSLINIDLSYNQLSGTFPSWITENENLQLNLVANNFIIESSNNSVLPFGLECLQRGFPCHKGSPIYSSFAIRCGGATSFTTQDGTVYQPDNANLAAASYYVTRATRWGVSNVGAFAEAPNSTYIIGVQPQDQNKLESDLFQNSRMSTSSLRYYGFGLQNGNYTVKLQFAELGYPSPPPIVWQSLGRRVFDIYIQGFLKEKNFNIKKEAGGNSFVAVVKNYIVPVTDNVMEIHFFWAGKGTCCIPTQGYWGPTISAISVSPYDFKPTVSNKEPGSGKEKSKTLIVVGVVAGIGVLLLALITVISILFRRRKKKLAEIKELMGIIDRPDAYTYSELRAATDAFDKTNILGQGGYGIVYKGKLSDGRIVAVKQLSPTSRQGIEQFVTEISTISSVQHKNLVKLYGCCVVGNKPLLVYEYLENGSLDKAIFGKSTLYLNWVTRFEICLGVARGLTYLHDEANVRIVHRDIKASNILLDEDLNPKISDFGLAKLYDEKKTHINTRVAGTIGYLAPEYAMMGHLTEKTDVFAFGVLVLEIVAGRSNSANSDENQNPDEENLLDQVWNLNDQNCVLELLDPTLKSYDKDQALRLIGVSLLCTQASPSQRPSMSRIVSMLSGEVDVNEVTSRPNYLTEWQFKDISGATSEHSRKPADEIVLLDSDIIDGR